MDLKKIGGFLKTLRQEKGATQEQAAEIFGVSGRTVSRWETGRNMPDLSILIQIADYYDVDIREILNGERKGETMDRELKDTLLKVSDYSEMEKEKAQKAGNTAFLLMFGICAAAIVIQMLLAADMKAVLGESAALILGSIVYLCIIVRSGIWEAGKKRKSTPVRDGIISVLCAGGFSIVYGICIWERGAAVAQAARLSAIFFVVMSAAAFGVLRILARFSRKQGQSREK